ncbi:MAG: sugar transferase, partial [Bacteroidetes bacterium]
QRLAELAHLNQYEDDVAGPTFLKLHRDPRVTRVGRLLRKTSLDELPQLFNVLKGDMSIVGNRPLPLYEAQMLTTDEWAERFLAPAGLTGLWQVRKKFEKHMSSQERIRLDARYARECSFLADLKIMLQTLPAVIQEDEG